MSEKGSVKILRLYGEWYHKEKQNESRDGEPTIQEFIGEMIDSTLTVDELANSSSDYNTIVRLLELND